MALIGALARQIYRSAVGMIRTATTALGEGAIARRLRAADTESVGQPFAAYQAIARQAIRGVAAAGNVEGAGNAAIPARELPRGPATGQPGEPIAYDVLVRVYPYDTEEVIEFQARLSEPGVVSYEQITQYVNDNLIDVAYRESRQTRLRGMQGQYAVGVDVLAAHRE